MRESHSKGGLGGGIISLCRSPQPDRPKLVMKGRPPRPKSVATAPPLPKKRVSQSSDAQSQPPATSTDIADVAPATLPDKEGGLQPPVQIPNEDAYGDPIIAPTHTPHDVPVTDPSGGTPAASKDPTPLKAGMATNGSDDDADLYEEVAQKDAALPPAKLAPIAATKPKAGAPPEPEGHPPGAYTPSVGFKALSNEHQLVAMKMMKDGSTEQEIFDKVCDFPHTVCVFSDPHRTIYTTVGRLLS